METHGLKKKIQLDGTVIYWYHDPKIVHTTFKDGLELYEFENGQLEKHLADGSREILFPDKTIKYIYSNGREECYFPDGRRQWVLENGDRVVELPSGRKEVYTREGLVKDLDEPERLSVSCRASLGLHPPVSRGREGDVEPEVQREAQQCEWIELQ